MNVLFTILCVLIIIAAVLLTIVVLLQNGKGGGLASNFAAGNQAFGVRQTADILEKITWGLVAFIFIVSVVSTFALGGKTEEITDKLERTEAVENANFPTPELNEDAQPVETAQPETQSAE